MSYLLVLSIVGMTELHQYPSMEQCLQEKNEIDLALRTKGTKVLESVCLETPGQNLKSQTRLAYTTETPIVEYRPISKIEDKIETKASPKIKRPQTKTERPQKCRRKYRVIRHQRRWYLKCQ